MSRQPPDCAAPLDDLVAADEEVRRLAVERLLALPDEEAIARLVESLGDSSWRVRKAAVAQLSACRDRDRAAAALIAALGDGDNSGRRNSAVEALVALGAAVTGSLVPALGCDDVDVRKLVIDALAGIADPAARPALIDSLEDPDPNVRAAAADALAGVGGEPSVRALSELALSDGEDPLVRFSALRSLARLEAGIPSERLAGALADPVLRPAGLLLLGYSDDSAAAESLLLKALGDASTAERESAIQGLLWRLSGLDGEGVDALAARIREVVAATPGFVASLLDRLATCDDRLREARIGFLGLLATGESVVPLLHCARDEALSQRVCALLATFGGVAETAVDSAWPRLDCELRSLACAALARSGGERGEARLHSSLDDSEGSVRAAAARALAERAASRAIPDLLRRLEVAALDEDPDADDERDALLAALLELVERVGEDAVAAVALRLAAWLESAAEPLRRVATGVLARVARPQDGEWIMKRLKDPSAAVRRLAVEGLVRVDSEAAAESLRLALADESALVRSAAATALSTSGRGDVYDDLQRLSADEDPGVRAAALRAIGARSAASSDAAHPRTQALDLLASALAAAAQDGVVAVAAVEALERIGGAEAARSCTAALTSSEPEVVRAAVACIARHGDAGSLVRLIALVDHPSWSVRGEAVDRLAERGCAEAIPGIARRLANEPDAFVRARIARALQRLEG